MSDQPDPETTTHEEAVEDDGGAALERAAESIHEARDAEGSVAASEDITAIDEPGEDGPDPEG